MRSSCHQIPSYLIFPGQRPELIPGRKKMEKKAIYLVRDEKRLIVDPSWDAKEIDTQYYKLLLDKAYEEIVRMLPKSSSRSN